MRRFLLKAVQNINSAAEFDCVDCPVRIAFEILNDLQNTCATETLEWLRLVMFLAFLGQV